MARTSDPHSATVKAWETRARSGEGSGTATQSRGDWTKNDDDGWREFSKEKATTLWKDPRPEYNENIPYEENRKREKAWDSSMSEAMSLGEISVDEALARGLRGNMNKDNIVDLPPKLYHVTTAAEAVMHEGLKSRDELGQESGVGLGGGDTNTVSFTTDPKVANDIYQAVSEAHEFLNGETTVADLDAAAKSGKGTGGKPYTEDVNRFFKIHVGEQGQALWREGYDPQVVLKTTKITDVPKDAKLAGSLGDDGEIGWMGGDGIRRISGYYPKLIPGSKLDLALRWNYFRANLTAREQAGGPIDPLFFSSDPAALARQRKSDIRIVEVEPHPGTRGFRESGLGEIRILTRKVVKRQRILRGGA